MLTLIFGLLCVAGCQSLGGEGKRRVVRSPQDAEDAEAVIEAVAGVGLSEEEVKALEEAARKDPETREAVKAIADSLKGRKRRVHYCPVTGRRFSSRVEVCPIHHVRLKVLEDE